MTPHLIHIGFAKAGSSFLQQWLAEHPQIAFAQGGIGGFRSVYDIARAGATAAPEPRCRVTSFEGLTSPKHWGKDWFAAADQPERGPDEEAQARVCAALAGLFPQAHVLLVTRGFKEMLLSGYSQYVRVGGSQDFYALRPPIADGAERGDNAWHYDRLVELYEPAFPGRLIVLPFELLRDDPTAFVGEIERRFELDPFPPRPERVNPSLSPVELRWYPRLTRLMRALPVGERARAPLLRLYARLLMANRLSLLVRLLQLVRPAEPVTPDLVTMEAVEYFRGRAERLRGRPFYARYADDYLL